MTATAHCIGFLIWPETRPMTLALAEEALCVAQRVHPEVAYEVRFLQADRMPDEGWRMPGEQWVGRLEGCQRVFLLADEPPASISPPLATALKQMARTGCLIGGLSAGVYPLAQLGLLDGYRAAVHWRWQDDFAERFPKVIATSHLFDWDRDRLTACGGLAVLDLLLAVLARDHGAELAGAVSEELVVERIREGGERQRIPLQNRIGSSHPKLTQAVLLMEANIEEPLTTDEIATHVCVSRRQLERIFKQYLNRVPALRPGPAAQHCAQPGHAAAAGGHRSGGAGRAQGAGAAEPGAPEFHRPGLPRHAQARRPAAARARAGDRA